MCIRKACLLGLARPAALSVHLVHGECPSKSWSGSGCAGTRGTPACARGNVLGHENTRSCSPRSSTCRAGDRRDTTIPSAEDSAHADVLSAKGTKTKAVEKNKHRAREGESERDRKDENRVEARCKNCTTVQMQTAAVIAQVCTHTRAHVHGITTQFLSSCLSP